MAEKHARLPFINKDTAPGLLLLLATAIALYLANSSFADTYFMVLKEKFQVGFKNQGKLELTIGHWINDGLMVVFFLLAGLEIKREIMQGELSTWRKASMPIMAAIGGMVVPALFFYLFNPSGETANGWGIPMATDIAYSLGLLALLGSRVPLKLKLFLTALAIADDLGAIMVIAIFYSSHLALGQLLLALGIYVGLIIMNQSGVKKLWKYILPGLAFWACFIHSGIHPTIAGVMFAFVIPINAELSGPRVRLNIKKHLLRLKPRDLERHNPISSATQQHRLSKIEEVTKAAQPPLLKLEHKLHGFNSFIILPLFALANAGVVFSGNVIEGLGSNLSLGIIGGLFFGKFIGISLFTYLGEKLKLGTLDPDLTWKRIMGLGFMAGIGFTMSLFISNLAFSNEELVNQSKLAILAASFLSAVIGLSLIKSTLKQD